MYDFANVLQARRYPDSYPPYETPPPDSPVLTPTEESGIPWPTVDTETQTALKFPTPVTEPDHHTEELDFSVADRSPDRYWKTLMSKLQVYVEIGWAHDVDDLKFDYYIELCMEELEGPPGCGWDKFQAVMQTMYENAKQQSGGSGVIRTAYCLMRENNCKKMCNVMRVVLLEF